MNRKLKVIRKFEECLKRIEKPFCYLIYGSIGRGCYKIANDIDSMIIFKDSDIAFFIDNGFLNRLPFDYISNLFDESDRKDLNEGIIDFLRVKGESMEEKVEFQMLPFSAIEKAIGNQKVLIVGTKKMNGDYAVKDIVQRRARGGLDLNGKFLSFEKNPCLATSGRRIDIREIGTQKNDFLKVIGLTLKKLLAPKIVVDTIEFSQYLDNKILGDIIISLLRHTCTGLEEAKWTILSPLLKSHKNSAFYKFGEKEQKILKQRFDCQIEFIKERRRI